MSDARSKLVEGLPPEAEGLGPPEQVHPALTSLAAPTGLALFATGFLVVAFGALFVYSGLYAPMRNATPEGLVGFGTFFAVVGVWLVATGLGYRPASMKSGQGRAGYVLFEDALAFCDGKRWRIVRWEDVEELTNPGGAGHHRLTTREAYTVPIDHSVKRYGALIARVVDQVTGHLVPRSLRAVEAGETLTFGPFTVSREALGYQGKSLAWTDLGDFTIMVNPRLGPRRLRVRTKYALREWCLVPLDAVPNSEVFQQVIQIIHHARILDPTGPILAR